MDPGSGQRDLVRVRGQVWAVLGRTRHAHCEAVRLRGVDTGNAGDLRTLLTPFDRPVTLERQAAWKKVRPRRWLHALRRTALELHPFGGLRTADESRIELLPYQLEPAIAILSRGITRVLIADEVGLGKTIQAGLILRELAARTDAFRAVIVMPASLRDQWRDELRDRFDLTSVRADAAWLMATTRELPADVNPWGLPGIYLASYDFVKRPEVLRPLEDVAWDLVVFDEAHAASPATDRRAAADAIASRGRRVVLLTATPHSGDAGEFDALCRLGCTGEDRDPAVMFQRSRMDAGTAVRRRTALLDVRPSSAERRMHRLLERYASQIHRESGRDDPRATLAAIVLRKRALSSAGSLLASVERRQQLLAGVDDLAEFQLALPLGDEDAVHDDVGDRTLAVRGLSDAGREQRVLAAIVRAAAAAAVKESKTHFLLRLLRRIAEPVIIFTEYRDTLARLSAALESAGLSPQSLHGGMSPDERTQAQRAFNERGSLLLATDAASEGLNLHHRCRTVIHYELPWSPVRLQQRTGRVDRIGQTRAVHEILLVAGDTAERLVLAPLARRAASARHSTAGASRFFSSLTESRIATAVLGGEQLPLNDKSVEHRDDLGARFSLRSEATLEMARLTMRRRWRSQSSRTEDGGRFGDDRAVTTLKLRRNAPLARSVVYIFKVWLASGDGQIAHAALIPVAAADGCSEEDVRAAAIESLRKGLDAVVSAHQAVSDALRRRERAMAAAVPQAARHLVQAGLFDRRAVRMVEARRRAVGALLDDAGERIDALNASEQLTRGLELTAKLLIATRRTP
jgi:superfamily II DNA or RNA helicase